MNEVSIWVVVPAAGVGQRMQSTTPKQYLSLAGAPVLQITIDRLLSVTSISGLVIALQDDDQYWGDIKLTTEKPVLIASGGAERSDSVLKALQLLSEYDDFDVEKDWVMVHDAVRPCVRETDLNLLIEKVAGNESGGLLAIPVRDTMKRQGETNTVVETVDRNGLWHALTPQLFPFKSLRNALTNAADLGLAITDESFAMEYAGFRPLLVQGHEDNIKITRPDDLRLAELYLAALEQQDKVN